MPGAAAICLVMPLSGRLLCSGVSKPVDVASANGKAFLNMATGGFGTEAAKKTDSGLKDKVGGAAYAITGELCSQEWRGGGASWEEGGLRHSGREDEVHLVFA